MDSAILTGVRTLVLLAALTTSLVGSDANAKPRRVLPASEQQLSLMLISAMRDARFAEAVPEKVLTVASTKYRPTVLYVGDGRSIHVVQNAMKLPAWTLSEAGTTGKIGDLHLERDNVCVSVTLYAETPLVWEVEGVRHGSCDRFKPCAGCVI